MIYNIPLVFEPKNGILCVQKGELPPGRTVSGSAFPVRDAEIESELNELRQKAREL